LSEENKLTKALIFGYEYFHSEYDGNVVKPVYQKGAIESFALTGHQNFMNANHQFYNLEIKQVKHDISIYISEKKITPLGQNII
jgi:hypothetical protein